MGVGALPRAAHAVAWAAVVLVAAALGPTLAPRVAGAALALGAAGALAAWRDQGRLAAGLAAVGAAPLLAAALLDGRAAGVAVLGLSLLLTGAARGALPRALGPALAAVGALLGLRQAALGTALAAAALPAPGLTLLGLAAGASVTAPRGWSAGLALALAGGLGLARSAAVLEAPVDSAAAAQRLARLEQPVPPRPSLLDAPAFGLAALAAAPRSHGLAAALEERVGLHRVLAAGWLPAGAPLGPDRRIAAARWLDDRGRGGEALRLLWGGRRSSPEVAWWALLLAREQGRALDPGATAAPVEALSLPGAHPLDRAFYQDGAGEVLLHLAVPIARLTLTVEATSYRGAPELVTAGCGTPEARHPLPEASQAVVVPGPLAAGPCRLRLRFDTDRHGPEGDRNVVVRGISGR